MAQMATILAGLRIMEQILAAINRVAQADQSDPDHDAEVSKRIADLEARWAALAPSEPPDEDPPESGGPGGN